MLVEKGQLRHSYIFDSSGLLLLTRTPSFPLYFLEKSHVEISFAACSWLSSSHLPPVPYHPSEYSISFTVVFALPISYYLSPFTVVLPVTFTAALGLWHGAVNAVICLCSYTTGYVPVFSEEFVSYHAQHAEECSRNAYVFGLTLMAQCVKGESKSLAISVTEKKLALATT